MIEFCGLSLRHRVINASGCFDLITGARVFGDQCWTGVGFAAYVSKTITLAARPGNAPPRLWESAAGLINSIGLPNRGLRAYLEEDLPALARLEVPLITNVMGSTPEEVGELVAALTEHPQVAAIELNVSCPNVATGLDIGADPKGLEALLTRVRPMSAKPLIVKLTPNAQDVAACAAGAEAGGADAVSLINTLRAVAMAPDGSGLWLGGGSGGLSGPAIRAIALAQVSRVARRVGIAIVGMGGVGCGQHARELLDVGATLVAVGTECFRDPAAGARIARELADGFTQNAA